MYTALHILHIHYTVYLPTVYRLYCTYYILYITYTVYYLLYITYTLYHLLYIPYTLYHLYCISPILYIPYTLYTLYSIYPILYIPYTVHIILPGTNAAFCLPSKFAVSIKQVVEFSEHSRSSRSAGITYKEQARGKLALHVNMATFPSS